MDATSPVKNFPMKFIWIDGIKMSAYKVRKSRGQINLSLYFFTEEQKKKFHDIVNVFLDNRAVGIETFFKLKINETENDKLVKLVGYTCSGEEDFGGLRMSHYQGISSCTLKADL